MFGQFNLCENEWIVIEGELFMQNNKVIPANLQEIETAPPNNSPSYSFDSFLGMALGTVTWSVGIGYNSYFCSVYN